MNLGERFITFDQLNPKFMKILAINLGCDQKL